jgi:AcrR family transcriptional regulator
MDQLVDAGARLLAEGGPAGLSLRRVAAAVGVSTMPVYTLFGDKQGLLVAMHREGFLRLGRALALVPPGDDPLFFLSALGLAYRQAALASPNLYGLMFGQAVPGFAAGTDGQAAADAAYRPLVEAVAGAQAADVLGGSSAERVALHLWAVAHGMVSLELTGQLPPGDPEELYAEALMYAAVPFAAPVR